MNVFCKWSVSISTLLFAWLCESPSPMKMNDGGMVDGGVET